MTLPAFLGPMQPLAYLVAAPAAATPAGGGLPTGANMLAFVMQRQLENNWCWAATTASVSAYFNSATTWTQCRIAATCLQLKCCATPLPCDVQYILDDPLSKTGNLQGHHAGNDARAVLQAQIDNGRPVCCHIDWNDGTGHFVAISGYDWSTDDVFVDDPLYGQDTVPFTTFVTSYRGLGTWDYTYYTVN